MSQCLCSLISVNSQGLSKAPLQREVLSEGLAPPRPSHLNSQAARALPSQEHQVPDQLLLTGQP